MSAAATHNLALGQIYADAGIELRIDSTHLLAAPPFGGELTVAWTDSDFGSSRWEVRDPNPARSGRVIIFDGLPPAYGWTARFFLWAICNANTVRGHKFDAKSFGSAQAHFETFKALVHLAEKTRSGTLSDLTQDALRNHLIEHCRQTPTGKPRSKRSVANMLAIVRRIYLLGPAVSHWIPDGLAFDPQAIGFEIMNSAKLSADGSLARLDEATAHRLVSTAINWVENFGGDIRDLRDIANGVSDWGRTESLAPQEFQHFIHHYALKNPHILVRYEKLRHAFPKPLIDYVRYGVRPKENPGGSLMDGLSALFKQTLEEISVDINPGYSYRDRFSLAELARIYPRIFIYNKRNPELRALKRRYGDDVVAAIDGRRAALGLDRLKWHSAYVPDAGDKIDIYSYIVAAEQETRDNFRSVRAQYETLYVIVTGMCYILVSAFTGWRISEILSIEKSSLRRTPVGFELGTKIRKTGVNPNAVTYRPVAPIVALAIELLMELNSENFTGIEQRLFRTMDGTPARRPNIITSLNAASLEAGVEMKLTSHQWRFFFVRTYLRRFKGNLDGLRRYFRHVSQKMIWAYAQDAANAKYLAKEENSLALEIAEGIILGDAYRSRGVMLKVREQYRALNMPPEAAEHWLRQQLGSSDLRSVLPTPWGYCLFQRGDVGAACNGKTTPIMSRAEPTTCGGCIHLVTGEENLPFWQTTALLHQQIAESEYNTPLLKQASYKMLQTCQNILMRHGLTDAPSAGAEVENGH